MSKHTPGPWFIAQTELWSASPYKFGVQVVADLHQSSHMEANANLIAAAPDLLEACEDFRNVLRSKIRDGKYREEYAEAFYQAERRMDRAIAKARGDK